MQPFITTSVDDELEVPKHFPLARFKILYAGTPEQGQPARSTMHRVEKHVALCILWHETGSAERTSNYTINDTSMYSPKGTTVYDSGSGSIARCGDRQTCTKSAHEFESQALR